LLDPNNEDTVANSASLLLCKGDVASIEQVAPLLRRVVELSDNCASQALAEALLYECLNSELKTGIPGDGLGRLKRLLSIGFTRGSWDFTSVFESVLPRVTEDRRDLYMAVGDAILDAELVPALDGFALWRETPPSDPFALN
jgi:hypothetical protein